MDANGCVPCAVFNSLTHGPAKYKQVARKLKGKTPAAKVLSMIEKFGREPSAAYAGTKKLFSETGMTPEDAPMFANSVIAKAGLEEYADQFLNLRELEDPTAHVKRVHGLLTQQEKPPIISLKTFKMAREKEDTRWVWNHVNGHTIAVLEVDPLPTQSSVSGFMTYCADSSTGAVIPVFLHVERNREFTATRDFEVGEDGELQWRWVSGYPYLIATTPDLKMGIPGCHSWQRVITVITHVTN